MRPEASRAPANFFNPVFYTASPVEELLSNVEEVAACYAEAGGAEVGKLIKATTGGPDSSQEPKFFFQKARRLPHSL